MLVRSGPRSALLVGFGVGGIWMGRLADRCGLMWPLLLGALCLGAGYVASGLSGGIWSFTIAQGLLVGTWAVRLPSGRDGRL